MDNLYTRVLESRSLASLLTLIAGLLLIALLSSCDAGMAARDKKRAEELVTAIESYLEKNAGLELAEEILKDMQVVKSAGQGGLSQRLGRAGWVFGETGNEIHKLYDHGFHFYSVRIVFSGPANAPRRVEKIEVIRDTPE